MHRSGKPGTPRGMATVRGWKRRHPREMCAGGSQERWGGKGGTGAACVQKTCVRGAPWETGSLWCRCTGRPLSSRCGRFHTREARKGRGGTPLRVLVPLDHDSVGLVYPLDSVSLNDLQTRLNSVVKVRTELAATHAKPITHSLGLANYALEANRLSWSPTTRNSLLRALKL